MITSPTTFIIGAGASRVYGLPLGSGLLRDARQARQVHAHLYDLVNLHCQGMGGPRFVAALHDLEGYQGPSIDAYLEMRPGRPDAQRLGRAFIAGLLGQTLQTTGPGGLPPEDGTDWLQLIVHRMASGTRSLDEFLDKNSVRFVTFNFDSVIETRMVALLKSLYDVPVDETKLFEAVPVLHVHGQLPHPPKAKISDKGGRIDESWVSWLAAASQTVKVVADEIDQGVVLEAHSAVAKAERLCFLGFSFHSTNVARLGLPKRGGSRMIFASAFGERDAARARFQEAVIEDSALRPVVGRGNQSCADLLLDYNVF